MLKLLFAILISVQSFAVYGDPARKPMWQASSFVPELERLVTKYGKEAIVLKGSSDPYTGTASSTSNIGEDVTIKWSFVNGREPANPRTYHSKLTGEMLSGEFKTYYPDGTKRGVIILVDGKQDGVTTTWHPNGKLRSTYNYSMGVTDGVQSTFYENGNNAQTLIVGPDKAIQWTEWNINGHKESFQSLNKEGRLTSSKYWNSEGKRTGSWTEYYDDGSMKKEKFYVHGRPERRWTTWYDNGTKNTESNFALGLLNGSFKLWNENGILVVSGDFKDSKEVGRWRFKDNNGIKIDRPKNLNINITDDGESIAIAGQANEATGMEAIYMSIYMPLAIALLVLLPLLGAGIAVFVIRRRR